MERGLSRSAAVKLAKETKGGKIIEDGKRWAVIAPPERAKDRTGRRSTRSKDGKPLTLVAFLRAQGGIKDQGGELRARDLHKRHPGLVNNKKGMELDTAREMAAEAGYIRPSDDVGELSYTEAAVANTTVSDFLDAIDNHPSYSVFDEAEVADRQEAGESADLARRIDEATADVREFLLSVGVPETDLDSSYLSAAGEAIVAGETDVENAYNWALLNRWQSNEAFQNEARANEEKYEWIGPDPFEGYEGGQKVQQEPAASAVGDGDQAPVSPFEEGDEYDGGERGPPGREGSQAPVGASAQDREAGEGRVGAREADIQADDSDEIVRVRLTRTGPWDFNDTYPDVDPDTLRALADEGRDPFGNDGELPSVEEVVYTLNESMGELQGAIARQRGGRAVLADLKAGRLDGYKKAKTAEQREQLRKDAEKDVRAGVQEARDIAGSVADLWGRDAAAAMLREAKRREMSQEASSPGGQVKAANAKADEKPTKADDPATPVTDEAAEAEAAPQGVKNAELGQIAREFNEAAERGMNGEQITHVFDPPAKNEIVRLDEKVKVYHAENGWMSVEEAKARVDEWKAHARAQGKTQANKNKVVLSLFDLTGQWAKPWAEAGYEVYQFDIQANPDEDVLKFSVDYFVDNFGMFDGKEVYAILAACPCTDFAVSGAKHFAAKDADGRTIKSVEIVQQTLATIEYFKPAVWAIENPVGRIEKLTGLPPWRSSWNPNHFGEPYTKRTLLWGRHNADMPIAPVEPTEGSKMWAQYGGKSQATKNARSETPEGFAYAFFMANNAIDHPVQAIHGQFDRLDKGVIEDAVKAGMSQQDVFDVVADFYYQDLDDKGAEDALRKAIAAKGPTAPTTEKGADGKPQLVILGAEKIGQGKLAQMKMDAPLKPKATQKDPGGLFSDAKDEMDLFADAPKAAPTAETAIDSAFDDILGPEESASAQGFNPATHVLIAADNIEALRKSDVERLFEAAPQTADAFDDLRVYIIENRPDLASEVVDAIDSVGMPARVNNMNSRTPEEIEADRAAVRAKGEAIIEHLRMGQQVTLVTMRGQTGTRRTPIKRPDQLKIRKDGVYLQRGNSWDFLFPGQVDELYQQIPEMQRRPIAEAPAQPETSKPPKTASEAAASAVKNIGMGLNDVTKGLSNLFGGNDPTRLGSGPTFDEETYAKALPFFKAGVQHFRNAASDITALARALVGHLKAAGMADAAIRAMRPYLIRFVSDVESGKIVLEEPTDAPGSSNNLEPDSGATTAGDGLGPTDVPPPGGGSGPGSGPRGGSPGRRGGGGRVPSDSAPIVGENGNLELPPREPEPASGPANTGESGGSGASGDDGLPVDGERDEDVARNAQQAANLEARKQAQARVGTSAKIIPGDSDNIAATLPLLFPEQQDDVRRAEVRYAAGREPGFLLTNGTGTGKTFSGLGVIARRYMAGERDILIVAPSQGILADWAKAASLFGIDMNILESTSTAGKGVVGTTYANLGANRHLSDRRWSLVVPDEAHKLTQGAQAEVTAALENFRAITGHPQGYYRRAQNVFRDLWSRIEASRRDSDERMQLITEFNNAYEGIRQTWAGEDRANVLFMSATPFAYHYSLDYAEGYLFSYGDRQASGYNQPDGRDSFYIENLGYRLRYNKLTKPDAEVDTGVMERELHERLKREGALWGRALEVERDYDRKFVLIDDAQGRQIDEALSFLAEADDGRFRPLWDKVMEGFDYLSRMRLLEAMKARAAVPYIRKQHALGRKVVVFHDYNEGGGFNPFDLVISEDAEHTFYQGGKYVTIKIKPLYEEFRARNPYVEQLRFSGYRAPLAELTANFKQALVYNGTIPNKKRAEAKALFNTDNNGYDLIIVQSAAGEAGISLHDITNVHQRVLLNLGMPIRPTTAIQQEGRIYRVGQLSDAMFRYMNTGTNWERWTFAGKIATRSGTAENLGMGNQARTLRNSFIDAFENSDFEEPGYAGEGTGGKAFDRSMTESISEFQKAKTHYFGQQKNNKRRDNREGIDYYPTPEPLGLKMVEWANIKPNDRVLEPSAGHGAIARYFPEDTHRTLVEPSNELSSRAALKVPGARMVVDRFENLNIVNKYDAIVMNPPFGSGGKTAIDHLKKAMQHLANGGRIVALIPDGQGMDRLNRLTDSDMWLREGMLFIARIRLPSVTFERAGTSVVSNIVILEKQKDEAVRSQFDQVKHRDLSNTESINELFDRIENMGFQDRLVPLTKEEAPAPAPTAQTAAPPSSATTVELAQTKHAKTGDDLFVVKMLKRVDKDTYNALAAAAKKEGGWWSSYAVKGAIPGFQFKSGEGRDRFLTATGLQVQQPPARAQAALRPRLTARAEKAGLSEREIASTIEQIARRVAGEGFDIRVANNFVYGGREVWGLWDVVDRVLTVSLRSESPANTAYHEAFHALQSIGVFSEQEIKVMEREAPRLRQLVARYISEQGRRVNMREMDTLGEATAWAFGYYAEARDRGENVTPLHIGVRRAFERGYQILRRIGNYFRGLGFQTSEDIFDRAQRGDYSQADLAFERSWDNPRRMGQFWEPGDNGARAMAAVPQKVQNDRSRMTGFIENVADRFVRIRELQNQFRRDSGQTVIPDVHRALGSMDTRIAARIEDVVSDEVNPLLDLIEAAGGEERVHRYLYVRHAEERNDYIAQFNAAMPDGGSGIDTATARTELAAFQAAPDFAELDAAARAVDAMIQKDLDVRLAAGLYSQQQVKDLRSMFQHYVPLRGFESEEFDKGSPLAGVGISVARRESPIVRGRKSLADSIIAHVALMRTDGIARAEKNRVDIMLFRLAQAMEAHYGPASPLKAVTRPPMVQGGGSGSPVYSYVDPAYDSRPNVVAGKIGGKLRYTEFTGEPRLAEQLKNQMLTNDDIGTMWAGALTRALGRMWTVYNPLFAPVNTARDFLDASVAASALIGPGGTRAYMGNIPRGTMEAIRAVFGNPSPDFERFRLAGGRMSWAKIRSIDEIERHVSDRLDGWKLTNVHRKAMQPIVTILEGWNDIFENAHRFALYQAAIDKGLPEAQAVKAALEGTMNFNRRGSGTLVRAARIAYPFMNPSIQAPLRAGRLIQEAGGVGTAQGRAQAAKLAVRGLTKTYLAFTIIGFVVGIWNYAIGGEDDDEMKFWDKAQWNPQSRKNMMIYTGLKDEQGRPEAIMIPAFPEIMLPFHIGNGLAAAIWGKQETSDIAKQIGLSLAQMSPTEGRGAAPAIVAPILEIWNNRNFFGGPIHPSEGPQTRGVPAAERKFSTTDPRWQEFARALSTMSGGSKTEAGFINMHPEDYRHLARSYIGGWYQIAEAIASGTGMAPDDKVNIFARRFYAPGSRSVDGYEREAFRSAEGKANAERAAIRAQVRDPSIVSDREQRVNAMRKRGEITEAGGVVGRSGGIGTPKTDVFDTGRAVISSLAKQRDAALAKASPAEKPKIISSFSDRMNAERKRFRRMAEDLDAGRIKYDAIRANLARERSQARNPRPQ